MTKRERVPLGGLQRDQAPMRGREGRKPSQTPRPGGCLPGALLLPTPSEHSERVSAEEGSVHRDQGESSSLGRRGRDHREHDQSQQVWPSSQVRPMRWGRGAAPGHLRDLSWLRHTPLCTAAPSSLSDILGDQGQVESKTRLVFQKNVTSGKDRTRQEGAGPQDLTSVSVSSPVLPLPTAGKEPRPPP